MSLLQGFDGWSFLTIVGLAGVTVLTRCFFFLPSRHFELPRWSQRGLQYAPIAALAAVIVPEIVMTQGHLISTWSDARLFAALAGAVYFYWRRGVLGTIGCGMAVYLPLHLIRGW